MLRKFIHFQFMQNAYSGVMSKKIILILRLFLLASVFVFSVGVNAQEFVMQKYVAQDSIAQSQNCLSDVQIQVAVQASQILPLNVVMQNAGVNKASKVLPPINVCYIDGLLFYQFSILNKNGKAEKLVLPAIAPLT